MIKDIKNVLITFGLVAITFGFGFSAYHEGSDEEAIPVKTTVAPVSKQTATNTTTKPTTPASQTTSYPTITTTTPQTTTPTTTTTTVKPSRQSKAS